MKSIASFELKPFTAEAGTQIKVEILGDYPLLNIRYAIKSVAAGISAPVSSSTTSPQYAAELWKKTCFEFFSKSLTGKDYYEWNFSPAGDAYGFFAFEEYRKRVLAEPVVKASPIKMALTKNSDGEFTYEAILDLSFSPTLAWQWMNRKKILINPTVILDDGNGSQRFWAAAHPSAKADFHDMKCWTEISLP